MADNQSGDAGAVVQSIYDDLDKGWGLPIDWYFRSEQYQIEQETIWNRQWLFFCPAHKLSKPGDTAVGWAGAVRVVLVHGRDRQIRGFVNLCRHRGYPVATEDKNNNLLICRYHAWTYDLDGRLRGAPSEQDEPNFPRSELSLLPVAVDTVGGLVFVNADPQALPISQWHPNLEFYLNSIGFPLGIETLLKDYLLTREIKIEFAVNWKLWYDNNTECYHCPTIHSSSFGQSFDVDPDRFDYTEIDRFIAYSFDPGTDRSCDRDDSHWQHSVQVFPGIGLTVQDDIMLLYQARPTGPETTSKILYCLVRAGADEEQTEACIDLWLRTFAEDKAAIELQQAGVRSGRLPRMRYMTGREPAPRFMNRLILEGIKSLSN